MYQLGSLDIRQPTVGKQQKEPCVKTPRREARMDETEEGNLCQDPTPRGSEGPARRKSLRSKISNDLLAAGLYSLSGNARY